MKTLLNKYRNIIIAILVVLLAGGMISSFYFSQKANEKEQFDYSEFSSFLSLRVADGDHHTRVGHRHGHDHLRLLLRSGAGDRPCSR